MNVDEVKEKIISLGAKAYAEQCRKTWQKGGRRPKVFYKTKERIVRDEAVAKTIAVVLERVFRIPMAHIDLEERAIAEGLINDRRVHKDDPIVMSNLIVKGDDCESFPI